MYSSSDNITRPLKWNTRMSRLWLAVIVLLVGCETPNATPQVSPQVPPQVSPPAPRAHIRVLVFAASWCGPCQRQKPIVAAIRATGVEVQVIDIDADPAMARQYGVTEVPTLILYFDGQQILRTNDANTIRRRIPR
jgi:thioredoxin 1